MTKLILVLAGLLLLGWTAVGSCCCGSAACCYPPGYPDAPPNLVATVSTTTGNCDTILPASITFSYGTDPDHPTCWVALFEFRVPTEGCPTPGADIPGDKTTLCCSDDGSGGTAWFLQEFGGLNPNCYSFRSDLSFCSTDPDLWTVVFDGAGGGNGAACRGVDDSCFCNGTFRVTFTVAP